MKIKLKNIGIMILIIIICTALSMYFEHIKMFESNIVMIYLLGVLLTSFLTEGLIYSLITVVCNVLLYNFFFIEPFYTFKVNDPNYFITFLVMFLVGFITSILAIRVNVEKTRVKEREEYITSLYDIEKKLLNVRSIKSLAEISAKEIVGQLNASVMIQFFHQNGEKICRVVEGEHVFDGETDHLACLQTFESGTPCGYNTTIYKEANAYYVPILYNKVVFGVIGIYLAKGRMLTQTQCSLINVITPQIAVVLDREKLYEKQQKVQIEIQKERLRSDMLRTISHDFRTPLTGIMGLASTAQNSYEKISDEVKKSFFQSIYDDASWLNEVVENILQSTRFEEGKVKLNLAGEAAEEIITEAVIHVKKHAPNHEILVQIPDEIILIEVDGVLIKQVLINLLNNAVNYSPEGSTIMVGLHRENDKVVFEVHDNGPGIQPNELPHVFERYFRGKTDQKGTGLGLSLCKTIIEAHNGKISVRNNVPHGTIISFFILSN